MRTTIYEIATVWAPIAALLAFFGAWWPLGFRAALILGGLVLLAGITLRAFDTIVYSRQQRDSRNGVADRLRYTIYLRDAIVAYDAARSTSGGHRIGKFSPGKYNMLLDIISCAGVSELTAVEARHESAVHAPKWEYITTIIVESGVFCICFIGDSECHDLNKDAMSISVSPQPFIVAESYCLLAPQHGPGEYSIHIDRMNGAITGFRMKFE